MSILSRQFILFFGGLQSSASGSDQDPYAPSIEWDEDETDNRPDFDVIFWSGAGAPFDTAVGDVLRIRNITLGSTYLTRTLTADDIAGVPFEVSVTPLANGVYSFDARIERGSNISAWSDSESVTVDAVSNVTYYIYGF